MEKFVIKTYSKSELAALYGVSLTTFKNWCKKITDLQLNDCKILTPKQVKDITNWLGEPF